MIDEVHERAVTQAENATLINIIDRRYDARRCTVLIANQDKSEFAAAMGPSIVSRIHETGEALECDWPNFRRPGGWKQHPGAETRRRPGEYRQDLPVAARRIT